MHKESLCERATFVGESTKTTSDREDIRETVAAIIERPHARVLVIGGGINGIATFHNLALQGVDVVLIERNDYASGASAASSHMIHGGIRYLENGELRLVKEAVQERNSLLRTAPHYVKPLQTTMPVFSTFSGILNAPLRMLTHKQWSTKERGAILIKIGMSLYDSFSRDGGTVPRHRFLGKKKALAEMPALNPNIKYTGTYYDASVHEPERLALDILKDGLSAGGDTARSASYVEAIGVSDGGVRVRDRESGVEFVITADVVVNASGPWTDLTNTALGETTKYMGGTKGSHIVIDNPELLEATNGREIFFENSDGRIVLVYPLKGRVLIGTTDIDADPSLPVTCTEDEIDYFFDLVHHVFPQIGLDRSQIVYTFAGIRPLPRHEDTAPGFVSRDYRIEKTTVAGLGSTTVFSLVGGKWTTFRASGESVADRVLEALGAPRVVSTKKRPIGGGAGFPRTPAERSAWISEHSGQYPASAVDNLLDRYGTRAAAVLEVLAGKPYEPLTTDPAHTRAEIEYYATHEQAVHLDDVILRRTNAAFVGGVTKDYLDEVAEILGGVLNWDADRVSNEVSRTVEVLSSAHGVQIESVRG